MDTILRAGMEHFFQNNFFQSDWTLTSACNFSCSYCVNKKLRKTPAHLPLDFVYVLLRDIRKLNRSRYIFSFTGGETTLYPDLEHILQFISGSFPSLDTVIRVLSNGSNSYDRYRSLLSCMGKNNKMFIISLHLEQCDYKDIITTIMRFSHEEIQKYFIIKIIFSAPYFDDAMRVVNILNDSGISCYKIVPQIDHQNGHYSLEYTAEQKDLLQSLRAESSKREGKFFNEYRSKDEQIYKKYFAYYDGVAEGLLHYAGLWCSAGYNSLKVGVNGEISRGEFCGDMRYSMPTNPFQDPAFLRPIQCLNQHCTCMTYARLPKWKSDAYAPRYIEDNFRSSLFSRS